MGSPFFSSFIMIYQSQSPSCNPKSSYREPFIQQTPPSPSRLNAICAFFLSLFSFLGWLSYPKWYYSNHGFPGPSERFPYMDVNAFSDLTPPSFASFFSLPYLTFLGVWFLFPFPPFCFSSRGTLRTDRREWAHRGNCIILCFFFCVLISLSVSFQCRNFLASGAASAFPLIAVSLLSFLFWVCFHSFVLLGGWVGGGVEVQGRNTWEDTRERRCSINSALGDLFATFWLRKIKIKIEKLF